jgi:hypothetical protein
MSEWSLDKELSEQNAWIALSYAWGDPAKTRRIFIDGKAFGVTENFFVALQHMCAADVVQPCWIDAICIN